MVCGGNALGGLWVGMCRVVLPDSHLMEAPVWLPHAMIARGQRLSPDPSASYDSGSKGQNISPLDGQPQHCSLTHHPQGPYEAEGCERVAYRDQRWKERSGTEDDIVSTALDGNRFGVRWFTFSKRNDGEAKCSQLMLGGSSLRLSPPGLSVGWPSCHLSNDFFILQEELVARGKRATSGMGKPDAGPAWRWDPVRLQPHHKGPTHPFILPVFLCFFSPSIHTVISITLSLRAPTCPWGVLTLLLSSNSFLLTSKWLFSVPFVAHNNVADTLIISN